MYDIESWMTLPMLANNIREFIFDFKAMKRVVSDPLEARATYPRTSAVLGYVTFCCSIVANMTCFLMGSLVFSKHLDNWKAT